MAPFYLLASGENVQLTLFEETELAKLEATIEHGLQTFVDVGLALMRIRDGHLYRASYSTFEDYCQQRWHMARQTAYQYIDAAGVSENVRNCGHLLLPANEAQARPLAKLEPDEQVAAWEQVVESAPEGVITAAHVKSVVREFERQQKGQDKTPAFPVGTFSVFYADPPWDYNNSGFEQSAASHYPTMTTEQICALPIAKCCTPETVLFLWATSPLLDQALAVLSAWGFTYKASIVWDKGRHPPIGWFVETEHELLLIGTGEANTHPQVKPLSVQHIAPGRHSEKPQEFYDIIESMYPGPYCELFARSLRIGWSSWGQEAEGGSPLQCSGDEDVQIRWEALGVGGHLEPNAVDSLFSGLVSSDTSDLLL